MYDISVTFEVLKLDKSKHSKSEQKLNIAFMLFTLVVFKFSNPFISFSLLHPVSINDKFNIFELSKLDKSK